MAGNLADIITYAEFQDNIFKGYDFIGSQIFHLPTDFCMGLTTVQRYCAAYDTSLNTCRNELTEVSNYYFPFVNFEHSVHRYAPTFKMNDFRSRGLHVHLQCPLHLESLSIRLSACTLSTDLVNKTSLQHMLQIWHLILLQGCPEKSANLLRHYFTKCE